MVGRAGNLLGKLDLFASPEQNLCAGKKRMKRIM